MPDVGLERVESAQWICDACVEQYELKRESVLSVTAHRGKCDVCGKESGVIPAGDFQWRQNLMICFAKTIRNFSGPARGHADNSDVLGL